MVPAGDTVQAPDPLQTPGWQPSAGHSPSGSDPLASKMQVPTFPTWLQAWQTPPQGVLQQTPSAHWPEPHCAPLVQGCPPTALQAPPVQV
jgi:uncharacterized protein YfaT (DUF1175 family)